MRPALGQQSAPSLLQADRDRLADFLLTATAGAYVAGVCHQQHTSGQRLRWTPHSWDAPIIARGRPRDALHAYGAWPQWGRPTNLSLLLFRGQKRIVLCFRLTDFDLLFRATWTRPNVGGGGNLLWRFELWRSCTGYRNTTKIRYNSTGYCVEYCNWILWYPKPQIWAQWTACACCRATDVDLQGRPAILGPVVRRTIYCVGKLRTIYFKNCAVVDVYSRVHSCISKFCMVAGLSAFFFFDLTDFDLLIRILHIVPVQQKFEKICRTAIESRSESRGSGPQICLPEGQRTTM